MSTHPGILFSHNHHLLAVKGCEAALDVLAFVGDEALSRPFSYRIEFTSVDHAISKETMLMKAASLTLQAPVDEGYGIKIQQPVRVIQGVVSGFERLSTSKDETRYALTLQPRLALLDRSHQNAIYQDLSVPQIVEKILRERHGMRGQDFLFSLSKAYPRREQVMQYGEDDLHFITRLLGEVGIWFRFTTDTRLNIDVVEFYDSQQGYEKGLTLQSVPPSGQHSEGVDSVWGMESPAPRRAEAGQHPGLQLSRCHGRHERSGRCDPRGCHHLRGSLSLGRQLPDAGQYVRPQPGTGIRCVLRPHPA
ncbi:VGR-related protein [Atlantibacter hermannii]|nr:VGR-related protein [Atlantibacter hermannii]